MKKTSIVALAISILSPSLAFAAFPAGKWEVSFYDSPTAVTASTTHFCINANNTWYAINGVPIVGAWSLDGNKLHMHRAGDAVGSATQIGELDRISSYLMTGVWQQWFNDARDANIDHYLTVSMTFKSATCN